MKCFIRSNNIELSSAFRSQVVRKIESSFSRVQDKVRFVVVSFQDINGLRGGKDKQCKVKVIGEGGVDVHVIDAHDTPQAAFTKTLSRAQHSFLNRVKKMAFKLRRNKLVNQPKTMDLLAENQY